MNACSCGDTSKHVVMKRRTADNHAVKLFSDGVMTTWDGRRIGLPKRAPSDLWKFMDKVGFYDFAELPVLYEKEFPKRQTLPSWLKWTVLHADTRGTPTERVCTIPRLIRAKAVILDFCGGPGSKRGRYQIMNTDGDTCFPTGLDFRTLRELVDFLTQDATTAQRTAP